MMPPDQSASTTQCILHWARQSPDAVAVIEHDASYTYGDLAIAIVQYATALRASGIRPGMLVALECGRRYLDMVLILSCEVIGATSLSLPSAEIQSGDDILTRCDFLCVVTQLPDAGSTTGILHLSQETIDRISRLPVTTATLNLLDTRPTQDQILRLVRTSGSTGRPKAMAMSQQATNRLLFRSMSADGLPHPHYDWNFINLYNLALRSAHIESMVALRWGQTVVSSHFATLFGDLQRFPQCHLTLVSGDAARLAEACPPDWPGPRACVLTIKGGPIAPSIRQKLLRDVVTDIVHNYGAIETNRLAYIDEEGVGTLYPEVTIRVVDEAGQTVTPGTVGLIEARSPTAAVGYLWDSKATRAAFVDGWYRTRDIGYMPAPGRIVVMGRADDVLNLGGVKFAPHPLEVQIGAIEGVQEAVLVAMQNTSGMDELHVVMELRPSIRMESMRARIGEILAPYARTFLLRAVTRLPRTGTGKVQRNEVRDFLRANLNCPSTARYTAPHHSP